MRFAIGEWRQTVIPVFVTIDTDIVSYIRPVERWLDTFDRSRSHDPGSRCENVESVNPGR
jgi:hypothetical protein